MVERAPKRGAMRNNLSDIETKGWDGGGVFGTPLCWILAIDPCCNKRDFDYLVTHHSPSVD